MTKIKAILWDYGNVLVRWSPREFYKTIIQDSQKLEFFLEKVCPMSWHHLHDSGIPMAQTIPARQKEFPEYAKEIQMWQDNFGDMILGEIKTSTDLVKAIKLPQYVLTNMPSEVVDICFEPFNLKQYFKDIIVSGDEKMAKPDKEIFELSLLRMGNLLPNEIIFIDDSSANIKTANEMGFHTYLFDNENGLGAKFKELGIL